MSEGAVRCVCGTEHADLWCPTCRLPRGAGTPFDASEPPAEQAAAIEEPAPVEQPAPQPYQVAAWPVPPPAPHVEYEPPRYEPEPEPAPEPEPVVHTDFDAAYALPVPDDVPAYEPVYIDYFDGEHPAETRDEIPVTARRRPGRLALLGITVVAGLAAVLVLFITLTRDTATVRPPSGELAELFVTPENMTEVLEGGVGGPLDLVTIQKLAGPAAVAAYRSHHFKRGLVREWKDDAATRVSIWLSEFNDDLDANGTNVRDRLLAGARSQQGVREFPVVSLPEAVGLLYPQAGDGSYLIAIVFVRDHFTVSVFASMHTRPSVADGRRWGDLARHQYLRLQPESPAS